MCGIAGIVKIDDRIDENDLKRMAQAIGHRGPDENGTWRGKCAGLVSTRLAVIDIEGGGQPMTSEDGRWTIVYNGEVYNHPELRKTLEARGHRFRTRSDTEVVLRAVMEWGMDAPEKMRGVFAYAAWDSFDERLLLTRDRLGLKPLYRFFGNGMMAFASEIKALLQIREIREFVTPDLSSIHEVMCFNFPLGDRTVFEGVREVPAGFTISWRNGRFWHRRYWDFVIPEADKKEEVTDEDASAAEFRERLEESVRLRLMSDVPLGVLLSGGLDSSVVAALVARETGAGPATFSIGFDEPEWDESRYSKMVAEHIGADHHPIRSTVGLDMLPEVIYHLDQPQRWAGSTSLLQLYRAASEKVKVVLTGEGADEILAGYLHMVALARAIGNGDEPPEILYWKALYQMPQNGAKKLYNDDFYEHNKIMRDDYAINQHKMTGRDPVDIAVYLDVKNRMERFVVFMQDRLSMAAGVEARVPFLDNEFVEYVAGIDPAMKLKPPRAKHILRLAARGLLPDEIVGRPKQGFIEPADAWMRGPLPEFIVRALAADTVLDKGFFRPEEVRRLLEIHRAGKENHGHLLIGVASVHIWHDMFFGEGPPEKPAG